MPWWIRHPIEALRWWYYEYDMPDWRSRIMKPYLRKHEHHDDPR